MVREIGEGIKPHRKSRQVEGHNDRSGVEGEITAKALHKCFPEKSG